MRGVFGSDNFRRAPYSWIHRAHGWKRVSQTEEAGSARRRNQDFIHPRGGTVLEPEDRLLVLSDKEALAEVRSIVQSTEIPVDDESDQEAPTRPDKIIRHSHRL